MTCWASLGLGRPEVASTAVLVLKKAQPSLQSFAACTAVASFATVAAVVQPPATPPDPVSILYLYDGSTRNQELVVVPCTAKMNLVLSNNLIPVTVIFSLSYL